MSNHIEENLTPEQAAEYAVYELVDPNTQQVRYVGATMHFDLESKACRFHQHCADARNMNSDCRSAKQKWIAELLEAGQEPIFRVVERGLKANDSWLREHFWIRHHRDNGSPLLNGSRKLPPKYRMGGARDCFKMQISDRDGNLIAVIFGQTLEEAEERAGAFLRALTEGWPEEIF